jgi:hypothetical protein
MAVEQTLLSGGGRGNAKHRLLQQKSYPLGFFSGCGRKDSAEANLCSKFQPA